MLIEYTDTMVSLFIYLSIYFYFHILLVLFRSLKGICLFYENGFLALQPNFDIAGMSKLIQRDNNISALFFRPKIEFLGVIIRNPWIGNRPRIRILQINGFPSPWFRYKLCVKLIVVALSICFSYFSTRIEMEIPDFFPLVIKFLNF